jgi:hypothetical protein
MTHFYSRIATSAALALVSGQLAPLPALTAVGMAPALAQGQYGTRPVNIACYSDSNRSKSCRLPPNTQSITYMGPDRSNRCREGETWRRRGNDLVVSNGCGGNFEALVYAGGGGGSGGGWGGGSGGSGGGWGGGGGQGFGGEVTCRSLNNRQERCYAETQNRVEMLQQYSSAPCIQGRTWSYSRNSIQVRNGCQARFGYGYGNQGGGGGWGGGGQWGQGFAAETECRSDNNRYQRCSANTQGRVEILRQISNTTCVQGRNWGYDNRSIWVDNGCSARFGYGYGTVQGDRNDGGGGSNAGAIIGGAALAAGLIALLAAAGKSSSKSASSGSSVATLEADLGRFPSDARSEADACLKEAARQVGATGGSKVRLDQVDTVQRSGEGWMILARLTATYDGKAQPMSMDCRAANGKVTAFDVR